MESCARFCQGLLFSGDLISGLPRLSAERSAGRAVGAASAEGRRGLSALDLLDNMILASRPCKPMRMIGNEMWPQILDADLSFVDARVASVAGK